MFKKILIFVTFVAFSSMSLANSNVLSEREFQECMQTSNDLASTKRSQDRKYDRIKDIQRDLRNLDKKLDNLDFQYEVAEAAYRGCLSANWGSCDQQARTLDYYTVQFNNTVDKYERLGKRERRAVDQYNHTQKTWRKVELRFNRECLGVKVATSILDKYCNNSSNKYCKGFKR